MSEIRTLFLVKDLRRFLFYCCAFTLPFHTQVNSLFIGLLIIVSIVDFLVNTKVPKAKITLNFGVYLFIGLGYFVWISIGIFYSDNVPFALKDLEQESSLLIFPIICYINRDLITEVFINRILSVFIASILILIVISEAVQVFLLLSKNEPFLYLFRWRHSSSKLVEFGSLSPTYFSLYCVFLSIVILFLEAQTWLKILILTIFLVFIFHLVNRMGILSISAILITFITYNIFKNKKDRVKWSIPIMITLAFLVFLAVKPTWIKQKLIDRNFRTIGEKKELVLDSRVARWGAVWNVIKDNWIFGVGTGDVSNSFMQEYHKQNLKNDFKKKYHAHNQFLQTWASNGLIGLFLFLIPFIFGFFLSIKKKNYFFLAFLLTFGIFSLTESTFRRQKGIVFYSLFNSIFVIYSLKEEKDVFDENLSFKQLHN